MDGGKSDESDDSWGDEAIIVGERRPARRTNWRFRYDSLNQRSTELRRRTEIQFLALIQMVQHLSAVLGAILMMVRDFGRRCRYNQLHKARRLLVILTVCLTFCTNHTSYLAETMHALSSVRYRNRPPPVDLPWKNQTIDEISDADAYEWTHFWKRQLRTLLAHWRIPGRVVLPGGCVYSGEEVMLIVPTKLGTGEPYIYFGQYFGGHSTDSIHFGLLFEWFINHLHTKFYHKISGYSLYGWSDFSMSSVMSSVRNLEVSCFARQCSREREDGNGTCTDTCLCN